jgi:hypothetical protein
MEFLGQVPYTFSIKSPSEGGVIVVRYWPRLCEKSLVIAKCDVF